MKILLVGEYSRLHNSLKEGLVSLGHEVTLIGCGDYFKNYPVDIKFHRTHVKGLPMKWKNLIFRLFHIDLASIAIKNQFFQHSASLKGFDVVQLINESALGIQPREEEVVLQFLKDHNKKLFVLSCGTDFLSVSYAYNKKFRYSILSPLFEGKVSKTSYEPILKYLTKPYQKLHEGVMRNVEGIIASDLDYHIPLLGHPHYLGLIPNPINTESISYQPLQIQGPIVIFHGINRANYYKKGSDYFETALAIIKQKYGPRIKIITTEDVPYAEYIQAYNEAHILLDQVLGYDQGYNALEAMSKGKVVFTGAEQEWLDLYQLEEDTVAINALPDVNDLVEKLSLLIDHPERIEAISKNARAFIEKEHHFKTIAQKYIEVWSR